MSSEFPLCFRGQEMIDALMKVFDAVWDSMAEQGRKCSSVQDIKRAEDIRKAVSRDPKQATASTHTRRIKHVHEYCFPNTIAFDIFAGSRDATEVGLIAVLDICDTRLVGFVPA
jgi:hypothetical protein